MAYGSHLLLRYPSGTISCNRHRLVGPHYLQDEFTQLRELIFVAPQPGLGPTLIRKGRTELKDIDADYKALRGEFISFTDVFNAVSKQFFRKSKPVFGPGPQVSLMVYDRVRCNRTKVWNLGCVLKRELL